MTVSKGSEKLAEIWVVPAHATIKTDDGVKPRHIALFISLSITVNVLILLALFVRLEFQKPKIEPRTIPVELVHEMPKPKPQPKPEEQKQKEPEKKSEEHNRPKPLIAGEPSNAPASPKHAMQQGKPNHTQEKPKSDNKPKPKPELQPSWATTISQGFDFSNIPDQKQEVAPAPQAFLKGAGGAGSKYLLKIQDCILAKLKYPAEAGGRAGTVAYVVRVARNGGLVGTYLKKSAGSPDLDRALDEAIRNCAPFPPLTNEFPGDVVDLDASFPIEP